MSANITPIEFEEEFYAIDIANSPMHFADEIRPEFMSPKPISPKRKRPLAVRQNSSLDSTLGKRDFIIAFGDDAEEQRYGQKIQDSFFKTNIGHGVFTNTKSEEKPIIAEQKPITIQEITDSVIQEFRTDFNGILRRERDTESKYDMEELLEWVDYYRKNRNLFNV
jgi:CRISPR/Cas system-associated endoribonuclease Cas2